QVVAAGIIEVHTSPEHAVEAAVEPSGGSADGLILPPLQAPQQALEGETGGRLLLVEALRQAAEFADLGNTPRQQPLACLGLDLGQSPEEALHVEKAGHAMRAIAFVDVEIRSQRAMSVATRPQHSLLANVAQSAADERHGAQRKP